MNQTTSRLADAQLTDAHLMDELHALHTDTQALTKLEAAVLRSRGASLGFRELDFNVYASSGELILIHELVRDHCEVLAEQLGTPTKLLLLLSPPSQVSLPREFHQPQLLEKGRMVIASATNRSQSPGLSRLYQVTKLKCLPGGELKVQLTGVDDEVYAS